MASHFEHGGDPGSDLDRTDDLPILDLEAYEGPGAVEGSKVIYVAPEAPEPSGNGSRPPRATALTATETLRDVEEWIASQILRDRANEQALAELQASQADANARADRLAAELESVSSTLQAALGRANVSERAVRDSEAAARAVEARASELAAELVEARAELASATQGFAAIEAERQNARSQASEREHAELRRALDKRASQVAVLETELTTARARVDEAERELARRAESIAALTAARDGHATAAAALERARCAAEANSSTYLENLQTREWQRNVWEGMWRDLDAELGETRATVARLEVERKALAETAEGLRVELAERSATIERFEADRVAQAAAWRELAEARFEEEDTHQATALELAARNAALLAEIGKMEGASRQVAKSLAARESELATARTALAALETGLNTAHADNATQTARIAELEEMVVRVAQALQAQTATAQRANALLEASGRDGTEQAAHIADLEEKLTVAIGVAKDRSLAAQRAESALAERTAELAASRDRLEAFEREGGNHTMRVRVLERELVRARVLAEQANTPRHELDAELERVKDELAREAARAGSLQVRQRELTSELDRTRGALEERDLQIRRLERQAAASAESIDRIKLDIERAAEPPDAKRHEATDVSAALVPLDREAGESLVLKRRTTIGRALDNDVCLQDSSISRHHAVILVSPNGSFIDDQKSANGVAVNGKRIRQARLAEGDVIALGMVHFRFTTRVDLAAATG